MCTRPDPAPLPLLGDVGFVSPQDDASSAISPAWTTSVASPGIPSILRKETVAMAAPDAHVHHAGTRVNDRWDPC
jgi:hypothetical protein